MRIRHLRDNPGHLDILQGSKQLHEWASLPNPALIIIRGSFKDRIKARDLAASIISILNRNRNPVVWVLVPRFGMVDGRLTSVDVLKQLVLQILHMNKSILENHSQPLSAVKFQCATTESEWFDLLVLVLAGVQMIYMVIDIEVFRSDLENGRNWPGAFIRLFEELEVRSKGTVVKVAIISYHTQLDVTAPSLDRKIVMRLNMKGREGRERDVRTKVSGNIFKTVTRRNGRF